ncbi:MAG: hypothetical protein H7259_07335, partial [Cytophagales bacterium]|nr:hypothetical protein [Cytophaga sp.]
MRLFILFVILLAGNVLSGQNISNIPVGTWRTHLPTTNMTTLALNKNKVYCASSISSFTLDQEDNHMSSFSKIDGLSESQIAVMRFNENKNTGIIGYLNGNIDFIINGKLVNFDVILRSNVAGSKKINNIILYDNLAFVSCDFGVSVIDIKKFEVKESWLNLQTNGLPNQVYACTLNDTQDSVFLATEYGAMSARYNKPGINLMDFNNWHVYTDISLTNVKSIASFNGSVYCGVSGIGVYILKGFTWNNIGLTIDMNDVCYNLI